MPPVIIGYFVGLVVLTLCFMWDAAKPGYKSSDNDIFMGMVGISIWPVTLPLIGIIYIVCFIFKWFKYLRTPVNDRKWSWK